MDTQQMRGRLLVLVTGSSRGFGRCVAEEFVRKVAPRDPVDLILVARSAAGLKTAAGAIDAIAKSIPDAEEVIVRLEAFDLGDLERLESNLDAILERIDPRRYARAVLVNNAGSLGHISFANELPSLATLRSEVDFNFTSAFWLSSRFAAVFGEPSANKSKVLPSGEPLTTSLPGTDGADTGPGSSKALVGDTRCASKNSVVVNISSLAALQPFECWSGYSAGKAARDMFHRVLAMEQAAVGGLKVLNYAPGPMSTDMARELRSAEQFEDDVRDGKLVDPKVSAEKCVRLILSNTFTTGAHVDFFDEDI